MICSRYPRSFPSPCHPERSEGSAFLFSLLASLCHSLLVYSEDCRRAAIPFRITSFAHPHHLTPIESYSCKKQGRGWGVSTVAKTKPFLSFPQPVNFQHVATPVYPEQGRGHFHIFHAFTSRFSGYPGVG